MVQKGAPHWNSMVQSAVDDDFIWSENNSSVCHLADNVLQSQLNAAPTNVRYPPIFPVHTRASVTKYKTFIIAASHQFACRRAVAEKYKILPQYKIYNDISLDIPDLFCSIRVT